MTYYAEQDRFHDVAVRIIAVEDQFVPHGSVGDLMRQLRMDAESIVERIHNWIKESNMETDGRQE